MRSLPPWSRCTFKHATRCCAGLSLILALICSTSHPATAAEAKPVDQSHGDDDGHHGSAHGERTSRISDDSLPQIQADPRMTRPKPILELGEPFLGSGNLAPGFELPGGAVLQPSFLVYGTFRTAVQAFDDGDLTRSEWVSRLDLFGNLQLSATERAVVGIRPLDEDGAFTGYHFRPEDDDGWHDSTNIEVTTLFFEGDFGEIFPGLDPYDFDSLDLGFSVGRQPLLYQDGLLINDNIDAIGIIRNTLLPNGGSDLQIAFLYGWNNIHRDNNIDVNSLDLFGMFVQGDYPNATVNLDIVYIHDRENDDATTTGGDGAYWGLSSVQRVGHYNLAVRGVGSHAIDDENAAVSSGVLFFGELSWTPAWTHDNVYINGFWGIDNFSSAARGPATGGPLGQTGILFAAVGLGRYGAPLGNRADDSVGGALGYQWFIDPDKRKQVVFEFGGRQSTTADGDGALAIGARYQQAIGQHLVLQLDAFGALQESRGEAVGGRVELRCEF